MRHVHTLVVGAGPTGLGAAWRLCDQRQTDWLLVEAGDRPGGAAASAVDAQGFTWDMGGHVIHSHFPLFDQVVRESGVELVHPQRNGVVAIADAFVPVPIQQNIASLSPELRAAIEAELSALVPIEGATDLQSWFEGTFGRTLTQEFFAPFNAKMWGHAPGLLDHRWTSDRSGSALANVPQPRLGEGVRDNSSFPYPKYGSGSLWAAVAAPMPAHQIWYNTAVTGIFPGSHIAHLSSGERVSYKNLISSMPLTHLMKMLHAPIGLLHSTVDVVGMGFDGPPPARLADKSYVYHPSPDVPFHRASVLSNYSPAMAGPGRWSVLMECGTSLNYLDPMQLAVECLAVLRSWGADDDALVSTWQTRLDLGYPVPSLNRDAQLDELMRKLEAHDIRSRGRFGGWRYESCNQDHAFIQGVEAVDAALLGSPELAYWPARTRSQSASA